MGTGLRVGLPCLHVVDIRTVLVSDDCLHPLDLQCFCDINALDVGMGMRTAQNYHRVVSRLYPILYKGALSGHQLRTIYFTLGLADIGQMIAERWGNLTLPLTACNPFTGQLDSSIVLFVAAIANEETTEDFID